jgi:hypothetical protein
MQQNKTEEFPKISKVMKKQNSRIYDVNLRPKNLFWRCQWTARGPIKINKNMKKYKTFRKHQKI